MRTIHLLNQFVYPDDAPTGLYIEQLGAHLLRLGHSVKIIGGCGQYRKRLHPPPLPELPLTHLEHYKGRRGNKLCELREYISVACALRQYIVRNVKSGDIVVVTSAPPNTLDLNKTISERGARSIFWLQDYYPELLRGFIRYPECIRVHFRNWWDHKLSQWDTVVKCASNLGYHGQNAVVIRNWPTLDMGFEQPFFPKTALYTGNLGYAHFIPTFLQACRMLVGEGYTITVAGDGPGVASLPTWIQRRRAYHQTSELIDAYWRAEVHLVAGHPKIDEAVFPSKIWNPQATGRQVITTGFPRLMNNEWNCAQYCTRESELEKWSPLFQV